MNKSELTLYFLHPCIFLFRFLQIFYYVSLNVFFFSSVYHTLFLPIFIERNNDLQVAPSVATPLGELHRSDHAKNKKSFIPLAGPWGVFPISKISAQSSFFLSIIIYKPKSFLVRIQGVNRACHTKLFFYLLFLYYLFRHLLHITSQGKTNCQGLTFLYSIFFF